VTTRHHLVGRLTVPLPPDRAFRLFTPLGERDWATDWRPRFPAGAADDDAPGTVFVTGAHGEHTVWVVTEREPGRRIRYVRVTPGSRAGTVTVDLAEADGATTATVAYDLTALTDGADDELRTFAAGYPDLLRSWRDAIEAAVGRGTPGT
jgi:hypothetical protein